MYHFLRRKGSFSATTSAKSVATGLSLVEKEAAKFFEVSPLEHPGSWHFICLSLFTIHSKLLHRRPRRDSLTAGFLGILDLDSRVGSPTAFVQEGCHHRRHHREGKKDETQVGKLESQKVSSNSIWIRFQDRTLLVAVGFGKYLAWVVFFFGPKQVKWCETARWKGRP